MNITLRYSSLESADAAAASADAAAAVAAFSAAARAASSVALSTFLRDSARADKSKPVLYSAK